MVYNGILMETIVISVMVSIVCFLQGKQTKKTLLWLIQATTQY